MEKNLFKNSFQIAKYLTWYRMQGASKLFSTVRKNFNYKSAIAYFGVNLLTIAYVQKRGLFEH